MNQPTSMATTPQPHGGHDPAGVLAWVLAGAMLLLVTLSGWAVSIAWDGQNTWRFALIAMVAGIAAALIARTHLLDGFAIIISIALGLLTVGVLTAIFSGHLEGGWWDRIRAYPDPIIDALLRDEVGEHNRDLTAETLLSLTVWMSSWIAMWMLVRVGFLLLALVAPTVLIVANGHFTGDLSAWIIVLMVALSLLIIIVHRAASQTVSWRSRRVIVDESVVRRVLMSGLAAAVIVSSMVAASPAAWSETVLEPMIERTIDQVESLRLDAQYWFDDVLGTTTAPPRAGSYTDFSDGFSVGGPLSLTDEPEVMVQIDAETAPYLKARTYDSYTGRGWVSSSAGAFAEADGSDRQSPELRYNPNWEVALSAEARNERQSTTAQITPLSPSTDTVFAIDSFLASDVQTVVRMSWMSVTDMPLTVSISNLHQLPPDVQLLGSYLLQSELSGETTAWGPSATSATMQSAIDEEVNDLARRGIQVRWTATSDGIVDRLFVTGRLPVFDDVEAVFRSQSTTTTTSTYSVTSLTSVATSDQLIAAGSAYPEWVVDRYLPTGDTLTARTVDLAQEIVGEETNPYLQAVLIEEWLRTNITYDESVQAPPGGQDLVDYVLFDNRNGYCEHYSAAMTVMLRTLGVPARVAVGYAPGDWDAETGAYLYRQNNAHAWVEVFFPGYGWIPFEPTANRPLGEFDLALTEPGADGSGTEPSAPEEIEPTEPAMPTADVSTPDVLGDNTGATPQPTSTSELDQPPVVVETNASGGPPRWLLVAGGIAAAAAAIFGLLSLAWNWSLRGLGPAAGLMARMQRVGGWMGVRSQTTTTPREYARSMEKAAPVVSQPIRRITRAYEIETFGPRAARQRIVDDAQRAWSEIRKHAVGLWRRRRR